jgi:hypothetical protein
MGARLASDSHGRASRDICHPRTETAGPAPLGSPGPKPKDQAQVALSKERVLPKGSEERWKNHLPTARGSFQDEVNPVPYILTLKDFFGSPTKEPYAVLRRGDEIVGDGGKFRRGEVWYPPPPTKLAHDTELPAQLLLKSTDPPCTASGAHVGNVPRDGASRHSLQLCECLRLADCPTMADPEVIRPWAVI